MAEKRRGRGDGSVYQHANGYWQGQIDLGWMTAPDGTRKRRRKTVTAKTRKDCLDKLRKAQRQVEAGVLGDSITVEEWLNHWLDHIAPEGRRGIRERTQMGYRGYLNTWLIPHLGRIRLEKLRPDHVRALYAAMEAAGKSDATRRQAHAILRRALVVAEREGRIMRNPAALVDPPPVGQNHHTPMTLEQARAILAALDGDPLAARWLCALLEGMRQGECLGLRWDDIDIEGRLIWVRNEVVRVKGKGLIDSPPKSRSSNRPIPMLEPVAFLLEAMERTGPYVFYGEKHDPRADWQAWKDLLVKAGVCSADQKPGEMPALHAARGTTASLLNAAGVPDKIIAEILGHSSVQITQTAYIHGDLERRQKAMKALEAYITPD